jgi:hypothetical protein
LGQQGTIQQRDAALRALGLMGGAAGTQQQNYMDQLIQALNAQGNLANIGMNQPYQTVMQQGAPSGLWQMAPYLMQGLMSGGRRAMGV